jgi:hypothetical protein
MEKIKFNDIVGMLERDEMREITGGCGSNTGCGVASLPGVQLNEVIVYTKPSSYTPSLGISFYGSYYNASNDPSYNNYGNSTNQSYNNYGGGGVSTQNNNPGEPTVANAQKFFSAHFPNFKAPVGGSITFKVGVAPPNSGTYIGANGHLYETATHQGVSGLTSVDATGKNFTVYLDTGVFKNDYKMMETLSHEFIHVHNIQDNFAMFKNDNKTFTTLSELAAYKHDVAFAIANGNTEAEAFANNEIKKINDAVGITMNPDQVNFHSTYYDIPLKP